mgnify:CR=1 FL=1
MRKIGLKDLRYGCFNAYYICAECGKLLFTESFSYDRQHISMGQKDEILKYMEVKNAFLSLT